MFRVLSIWLMLCVCSMSLAQNPLDLLTPSEDEYSVPKPNELSVKWWQEAIKNSPPDQPLARLEELASALDIYLDEEKYAISQQAAQAISQFKNNLDQLAKLNEAPAIENPEVYEKAPSYSLAEIYEFQKQIRSLEQSRNQRQETINSVQQQVSEQEAEIDALIIQHRNEPLESLTRLETGLLWIEARSWQALFNKQIDNLELKQQAIEKQLSDLQNHLADALPLVQVSTDQLEDLEQELETIGAEITEAQSQVQAANLKITEPEQDSPLGAIRMDIKKLELANLMLDLNVLELKEIEIRAHIDWINTSMDGQEVDDDLIMEHVALANQLNAQSEANQGKWRNLAQDILIQPALREELKKNKTINDAALKRTRLAQELMLSIGELDWQQQQVNTIEGLLTKQVIDSKSGINRLWAQIRSYGSKAWIGFETMANQTLFKINETPITLMPLLRLILIVLIGYMVSKFVRFIIRRVESRRQVDKSSVFFILDKLIHYLIIFVATIAGFTTLGIDFTNLTLIAGALSVGIGFGLQNIVSNFVSGRTIMFERSLKVGDYIEMEDGYTGSVMEINARSTRINTNDNIDVVIPNSDLVTNKIINWTLRDSIKRVKIPFGVAYGTDKDLVKQAAIEAAENVTYTLTNMKGKEPEVWMTGFGDNSLDFVLLVWVSKYGVRRPNRIKASFFWELDTAFNKHGIEIPFPQRVLHQAKKEDPDENPDLLMP